VPTGAATAGVVPAMVTAATRAPADVILRRRCPGRIVPYLL
jgi:hypothetical protein